MHPAQIKAALTIAGYKQTEVADACGVAPTTVGAVINGRSRSKKVEEWISTTIGVALRDLWPQWYGEGELVLSAEERELVRILRTMTASDRLGLLEMARRSLTTSEVESGSSAGISVKGNGNRVAGRDFHEGSGKKK
ncbi:helix-turn-helix domain-containing protein [Luteibacter anthropi]|uniref:helix-turn-helix domain-containing protein n=1 Tax=Luteibacter anthropi TaxID=564369 RepID=UPI0020324D36|nr:helix-turn-helix domain-containing protein [Luteibacter anthropi]URX63272.1 helix-turn-helix domain-containing protein [Luteibacter anthropi]